VTISFWFGRGAVAEDDLSHRFRYTEGFVRLIRECRAPAGSGVVGVLGVHNDYGYRLPFDVELPFYVW
jgi:hypothetical protein